MLLPGVASLARAVEFGTVVAAFARTIELRTLAKRPIAGWAILVRMRKTRALIAAAIVPLLPRLRIATVIGEFLARATITAVRRTSREFLVAAKFPLGTITARTIAVARRPRAVGTIALRSVAILAESLAARRVRALLATALAGGIGTLVAEFLLGKA